MTAKEKASDMITGWELRGMIFSSDNREKMVDGIARLLKEQDRDTRHACAEAVNALPWETVVSGLFSKEAAISRDDAHAACVNARVV